MGDFTKFVQAAKPDAGNGPGNSCGNGVCQSSLGETASNCPSDCGAAPAPSPTPPPAPSPTPPPTSNPSPTPPPNNPSPNPTQSPGVSPSPNPSTPTGPESGTGSNSSSSSNQSSGSTSTNEESSAPYPSPTVTVTSNTSILTNQKSIFITGTAESSASVVSSVQFSMDGGLTWSGAEGSNNFTVGLFLDDGSYSVLLRAIDGNGVTTGSDSYARVSIQIVTTPPQVSVSGIDDSVPTKNTQPTIKGTIRSDAPLSRAEYSIDGGASWTPITPLAAQFSKQLPSLEDGNYTVVVRVLDAAGNSTTTAPKLLIVDTIPPIIGGSLFSVGPQSLSPRDDGSIKVIAGVPFTYAVSTKGGTTDLSFHAQDAQFTLSPITNKTLWKTTLQFDLPGSSSMSLVATDGAKNTVSKQLQPVTVLKSGSVVDLNNDPIQGVRMTLYYLDSTTSRWVIWDADAYGQRNPQVGSTYGFIIPPGTYYLEVQAANKTYYSNKISTRTTTYLNDIFQLPTTSRFSFLDQFKPLTVLPHEIDEIEKVPEAELTIEHALAEEKEILERLKGKKSLLIFVSTWSPPAMEQLAAAAYTDISKQTDVQIIPIFVQQSKSYMDIYLKESGYDLHGFADPNGTLSNRFGVSTLPHHVLINSDLSIAETGEHILGTSDIAEKIGTLH